MFTSGSLTLNAVLRFHAESSPGRVFLIWESVDRHWSEYTYGDFDSWVDRIAGGLLNRGIKMGDRVVVHMNNRPEFLAALLAVTRIGAIVVPTIASYTGDELRYVVDHADAAAIVCDPDRAEVAERSLADSSSLRLWIHSGETTEGPWTPLATLNEPLGERAIQLDPSAPAVIAYSSGTTARPKGVVLSHQTMLCAAEANAQHQRMRPDDRSMCVLPLFHGNAMFISAMACLSTGSCLVLAEKFVAERYWSQVRTYGATIGNLVAAALRAVLAQEPRESDPIHALRFMLTGMPLTEEEVATFERRFNVPLVHLWGMTENAATGTRSPLYWPRRPRSIGLPMLGSEAKVLGPDGKPVPPGEPGELVMREVARTDGYFRDEELTRAAIDDGWLRTGDVVRADNDGYLTFVDRRKDVIKVRGENVASVEVERVLLTLAGVQEVAVIGIPDAVRDERIVAFLVVSTPGLTVEAVQEHCRASLAYFKVPHEVRFVSSLPKTSIGKIKKGELRAAIIGMPNK